MELQMSGMHKEPENNCQEVKQSSAKKKKIILSTQKCCALFFAIWALCTGLFDEVKKSMLKKFWKDRLEI